MALPGVLQKVLDWLHAGYPKGVPPQDYYPLLALLVRNLSEEEVLAVATAMQAEQDPPRTFTSEEVEAAIEVVTSSPPVDHDVRRVEEKLREVGWQLGAPAGPPN